MNKQDMVRQIAEMVETPVGRLVAEGSHRACILEQHGIDYCCGGRRTLAEACREQGLMATDVAREMLWADTHRYMREMPVPETDWNRAPLGDLCDHIQRTHHEYLRVALPRISYLLEKVVAAHGATDARLYTLQTLFDRFREDLENHTLKEEQILFPWIRTLERAHEEGAIVADATVPVAVLMAEHDEAGEALRQMRVLTDNFTAPNTACMLYRALVAALRELEADMHQHVHKENNILFPRALETRNQADSRNNRITR